MVSIRTVYGLFIDGSVLLLGGVQVGKMGLVFVGLLSELSKDGVRQTKSLAAAEAPLYASERIKTHCQGYLRWGGTYILCRFAVWGWWASKRM